MMEEYTFGIQSTDCISPMFMDINTLERYVCKSRTNAESQNK